ncbi:MAG TPA: hypothetical protein VK699_18400 [Terriglobales bacterium]|jgi:hypothetical protein|nr:hypothetical protein [Terriglobales bacterium]
MRQPATLFRAHTGNLWFSGRTAKAFSAAVYLLWSSCFVFAQTKITGKPGVAVSQAVVNFSDLARQEMLHLSANLGSFEAGEVENKTMPRLVVPLDAIIQAQKSSGAQSPMQVPASGPQAQSPSTALSFQAAPDNNMFIPPDTNGAVGPNHLMVTLNGTVKIQNRAGGLISQVTLHSFWASVVTCTTNPCESDPKIVYDPYGARWIFATGANLASANSEVLIGVSQTNDPTGNWNLYMVRADPTGTNGIDFTELGFNKNWIVVTYNMFSVSSGTFAQANAYVFNKANLYAHGAANFTLFTLPPDQAFALAPAVTYDNTLSTLYVLQEFNGNFNGNGFLQLLTITGPVGSETLTTGPFISTPNPWDDFVPPIGDFAPQLGSINKINTFDARITNLVYRNGTLWAAQHIFLPSGAPTRAAVQWWQLGTDGSIQQLGRIDDSSGTFSRTFPSIAVNKNNDVLIGYSLFSSSIFASAAYSFRAATDVPNTLQSENILKAGLASYFKPSINPNDTRNRWGDFSYSQVDPVDDTNLWTIQEYANSPSNEWATWWGKIALATHFQVTTPAATIAGVPFSVTVTAQDASNTTVASYTGTVHFTTTGSSTVPADYTFVPADNGVHTFTNGVTLTTAGGQIVSATDTLSGINGNALVAVTAAAAKRFAWSNVPLTATLNIPFSGTLTAFDNFNNIATTYTGSVQLSTTGTVTLPTPNPYTFTSGASLDNGIHTFSFTATGGAPGSTFTITGNDAGNAITATSPSITVTNDQPITGAGRRIRMFRASIPVVLATFTDQDPSENGSHLTATINWGDGSSPTTGVSPVQVGSTSNFNVMGAHSYAKKSMYTVTVTLTDNNNGAGNGSAAVATSTVTFLPMNSSH